MRTAQSVGFGSGRRSSTRMRAGVWSSRQCVCDSQDAVCRFVRHNEPPELEGLDIDAYIIDT